MVRTNGYALRDAERALLRMIDNNLPGTRRPAFPPVNVLESDEAYTLEADLPGRSLETILVRIEDQLLTLESPGSDEAADHGQSRRPFRRSFSVPRDVESEAISAVYRQGVLTLTLPKRPESRPRSIAIES